MCLLPFPDDYYTVKDKSMETKRRINLNTAGMPANEAGVQIEAAPYNLNDGFSPGQTIVVKVPGLDTPEAVAKTEPGAAEPARRLRAASGSRSSSSTPTPGSAGRSGSSSTPTPTTPPRTALLIHPARNFDAGHRYIVAMRKLKDADGEASCRRPRASATYRDDLPLGRAGDRSAQRKRFEQIFRELRKAEIKRNNLYLAWDFTVASDENIAARVLQMRDDAFAAARRQLDLDRRRRSRATRRPSRSPRWRTSRPPQDAEHGAARAGHLRGPLLPDARTATAGRHASSSDADGLPSADRHLHGQLQLRDPAPPVDAPGAIRRGRPRCTATGCSARPSQATSSDAADARPDARLRLLRRRRDRLLRARTSRTSPATSCSRPGQLPAAHRPCPAGAAQRALPRPADDPPATGFVQRRRRSTRGRPTLGTRAGDRHRAALLQRQQPGRRSWAAPLTAVAPDFTRATLGVPAMNYSVLLNRSVDFDHTRCSFEPVLHRRARCASSSCSRSIQMLWDRGEANGYAHRMTDEPLPNTPAHEVLMNVGFGDHQVTTWQADVEARTIGAQIHDPVVYDGRWPNVEWSGTCRGSAATRTPARRSSTGTAARSATNPAQPIRRTCSARTRRRSRTSRTAAGRTRTRCRGVTPAEQQMVSDFLRPDAQSKITDTCNGIACFDYTFSGP